MLILGIAMLIAYLFSNADQHFDFFNELTIESIYMLVFMGYMLVFGYIFSPDKSSHISQWITCIEYFFLLIIISSIIHRSGPNTFFYLLLFEALILALIFIRNPIYYKGRYTISTEKNPNALGMSFALGIWSVLNLYQKKKIPLIFVGLFIGAFLYCIILTGSRKSLIATGLIIGIWLLFCFIPQMKREGGYKGFFTFILMTIIVTILGHFFINQFTDSIIANRMNELAYETSEGERSNLYRVGYELFLQNPLFGMGFQGFKYAYGSYSHATLVEIPVSGGIIGTILYFSVYYISIKRVFKIYRLTSKNRKYENEHMDIKMIIVLWIVMLFYTTCIIHQYQFESFVLLGLIFGNTAHLENILQTRGSKPEEKKTGSRYIKR